MKNGCRAVRRQADGSETVEKVILQKILHKKFSAAF